MGSPQRVRKAEKLGGSCASPSPASHAAGDLGGARSLSRGRSCLAGEGVMEKATPPGDSGEPELRLRLCKFEGVLGEDSMPAAKELAVGARLPELGSEVRREANGRRAQQPAFFSFSFFLFFFSPFLFMMY